MPRVLVISYYWPPSGGPGVQRTLKFCKYLGEFGWEAVVLTVKNGNYPAIDKSLSKEIPEGMIVHRSGNFEPFALYNILKGKKPDSVIPTHVLSSSSKESFSRKFFKWVRANLFLPDARVGWYPYLIREGRKMIRLYEPEVIFSSSPPHSLQLGAAKLSEESGIPLVADLRDPWTEGFWLKNLPRSRMSWALDKKLESYSLKKPKVVTTVSNGFGKLIAQSGAENIQIVSNGYDEADFYGRKRKENSKFTICYTGNLRTAQYARAFFDSIDKLSEEIKADMEMHFWGSVHENVKEDLLKSNSRKIYNFHDYIPHTESIQQIVNADLLVVFSTNTANSSGVITAKVYEYIRTGNYIIGYGKSDNEISELLEETQTGRFFEFGSTCEDVLKKQYRDWKSRIFRSYGNKEVAGYSRQEQTRLLASIFNDLRRNRNE